MQKLNCYICDFCRVVIDYGLALCPAPHFCSKECGENFEKETKEIMKKEYSDFLCDFGAVVTLVGLVLLGLYLWKDRL